MPPTKRVLGTLSTAVLLANSFLALDTGSVTAAPCDGSSVRGNIEGEGDRVRLTLGGISKNCATALRATSASPRPHFTHEIACSPDRVAAAQGVCSATPCPDLRLFFAVVTQHNPDGTSQPAGFRCVSLSQAVANPGITVAQVFEAVRRVKLPGGEIGVEPRVRGLANLESYFWVEGATQEPVDLQVGGSTVHAEFRVVESRWSFGGGEPLVTTGPGRPGLESEVRTTFTRRGFYRVGVTVMWVAEAYLDGRRVGEVDDLVSQTQTTYPVAELRTVLTG
jgi:hypothetical protein